MLETIRKTCIDAFAAAAALLLLASIGLYKPDRSLTVNLIGNGPTQSVQATVYCAPDFKCSPCDAFVKEIDKMPADGWIVKRGSEQKLAAAHIVISKEVPAADLKITAYPTTIIRQDGKEVERFSGKRTAEFLAARYNATATKKASP